MNKFNIYIKYCSQHIAQMDTRNYGVHEIGMISLARY